MLLAEQTLFGSGSHAHAMGSDDFQCFLDRVLGLLWKHAFSAMIDLFLMLARSGAALLSHSDFKPPFLLFFDVFFVTASLLKRSFF